MRDPRTLGQFFARLHGLKTFRRILRKVCPTPLLTFRSLGDHRFQHQGQFRPLKWLQIAEANADAG